MYEDKSDFWMAFILGGAAFSIVWIAGAYIFCTFEEQNERIEKLEKTIEQCNQN